MDIKIIEATIKHKQILKNLYIFFRYELLQFIDDSEGAFLNKMGTINGENSKDHEEAVSCLDILWEKSGNFHPYLVFVDNNPAGFIIISRPPYTPKNADFCLNDLFIVNKYRGKGVAKKSMPSCIRNI